MKTKPKKTTKRNPRDSFLENQSGKIHILLILILILIVAVMLIIKFGLGKGGGDGQGDGEAKPETENKTEAVNSITPAASPDVSPAPKQFSVIVEKAEILFDNEKFDNVQSLLDAMQKEAGTNEGFSVILHDENAIANTLEDLKNALDKNGIPWATPTPVQTPKE